VYTIQRQQAFTLNRWFLVITAGTCVVVATVDQEEDEQLWTGADDIPFNVFGDCGGVDPIGELSAASYRTQNAALVDFPDLQVWDWD